MDLCEHCSELLLDYLYDLLDTADAAQVHAHLDQCAACRADLAEAESQQRLIARAARLYQSVPAFLPPMPVPATPSCSSAETIPLHCETLVEAPKAPPRPAPARRLARPAAWLALAASVLIAVGIGFGLYHTGLAEREQAVQTAERAAKQIDTQYSALAAEYTHKLEARTKDLQKQELHVQVAGPTVYRPTVGNTIYFNAASLAGKPVVADVTVRVTEEKSGKEVYQTKAADILGDFALTLPPQLGSGKAGEKWKLEVEAASMWANEKIQQSLIVAPDKFVTQLVTSKSEYEVGELLFFRTLTLEQFTLQPPDRIFALNYSLVDAAGTTVKKLTGPTQFDGVGGGEFALTEDLADGTYTLRVEDAVPVSGAPYHFAPQTLPVVIRQPLTPKIALEKQLSPGAKVNFSFQGGPTNAHQPVTVTMHVKDAEGKNKSDKAKVLEGVDQLRADAQGNIKGVLTVPKDISPKAQADLEIQVHDGKLNQKFVQTVPVIVPEWKIGIFPEGGALVAGLPNRVYCQALTPGTLAATLQGEVRDGEGKVVATVAFTPQQSKQPSHQLAGVFTFTPQAGETYKLHVGTGQKTAAEKILPAAKANGVTLTVGNPVEVEKTPLQFTLHASEANYPVLVVAACRGQVVGQQLALAQPKGSTLELAAVAGSNGVIRLTVYQPTANGLVPLAERLVYRVPEKKLTLSFAAKKNKLAAGQKAELDVKAFNENRELATSNLLALVVDESADVKERAAQLNLPAYFYLTTQVQTPAELENATFLLGPNQASRQALDRFLSIQGWRIFVLAPAKEAKAKESKTATPPLDTPALFCRDNFEAAQGHYEKTLATLNTALRQELTAERERLQQEKNAARERFMQATLVFGQFQERVRMYVALALATALLLAVTLAALFLALGLWRVARALPTARRSFAGAFVSLGVGAALLLLAPYFIPALSAHSTAEVAETGLSDLPALPEQPPAKQVAQQKLPNLSVLSEQALGLTDADKSFESAKVVMGKSNLDGLPGKDKDGSGKGAKGAATDSKKTEIKQTTALVQGNAYFMKKPGEPQALAKSTNGTYSLNQFAKSKRFQSAQLLQDQITFGMPQMSNFPATAGTLPGQAPQPGHAPVTVAPPLAAPQPVPPAVTVAPPYASPQGKPSSGTGGGFGGYAPLAAKAYHFPDASNYARQFMYEQNQLDMFHPDTLLWSPNLLLEKGNGTVLFDLPPYSATYRVYLIGNDAAGRLGFCEGAFEVKAK